MNSFLTPREIKAIKIALWYGDTREAVASDFKCSMATIHQIAYGQRHGDIPWPDESTGGMTKKRLRLIMLAKRQAAATGSMRARVKALLKEAEEGAQ